MAGIISYGAYIPLYRLTRAEISKSWGRPPLPGEKAVANFDEDSLTMGVAAAMDCTMGIDRKTIDGLYFASTTSPYKEKQAASTIATALNLDKKAFTVDFSGSLRSATNATRAALDAVVAGSARSVLVCASDTRLGYPNGDNETSFGDGAAAILVGNTSVVATIEGSCTVYNEMMDVWRSDKDDFVLAWEDRFIYEKGYTKVVSEAISAALKEYNLTPKDFFKAALYAPNQRQLGVVARKIGFDLKTQIQDALLSEVGNTGTALPLMSLVEALEEAKAGDRILLASYGDGCDVYMLKVTDEIKNIRNRRGIKGHLTPKQMLASYQRYLVWRELVETEPPRRVPLNKPSAVALWRDNKGGLALYGVKCKRCGTPQYPSVRICRVCKAKDEFEEYCFADKTGKITAFTNDNLGVSPDPPISVAVIDFDGGGRMFCDVTDRRPEDIKVGTRVEMTFRKIRYVGGIYDYWWKCRPPRS